MSSRWRIIILSVTLILLNEIMKVHLHWIRLIILAAAGLLGLWLLHQLAQDWNRIQNNGGIGNRFMSMLGSMSRFPRISKRSVSYEYSLTNKSLPDGMKSKQKSKTRIPKFKDILKYDKKACARKFVCYLAANQPTDRDIRSMRNEFSILKIFQSNRNYGDASSSSMMHDDAFLQFQAAADIGWLHRNTTDCTIAFKSCAFPNYQLDSIYHKL